MEANHMDPIKNPFSPGAGSPPYDLFGRENILEQARILLGRIQQKRSEKSMLLTGLRGVGKTVLLNEIDHIAREQFKYKTIFVEALEDKPLAALLIPDIRRMFFELDRLAGMGDRVRRGLAVLKSFMGAIKVSWKDFEIGLDIDPETGTADTGDIQIDLPNLFVALGEAAEERKASVAVLIDEVQYFGIQELSALILAMHRMQQRRLPLTLIGAGLPILPALTGESKSYAERLFDFPVVGPLSKADAHKALQEPVKAEESLFHEEALEEIYHLTQGYPYFIQEWGYQAWNLAAGPDITMEVIRQATKIVVDRLDRNFFRVRFDRLTPKEKEYLRAMASLGSGPYRSSAIASVRGVKTSTLGPVRERLIRKGMIYSPAYGETAFTVPLFSDFMLREMPSE
jgi:hypothetical protein